MVPPITGPGAAPGLLIAIILLLLGAPGAALGRPRGGPGAPGVNPLAGQPTRKIFVLAPNKIILPPGLG